MCEKDVCAREMEVQVRCILSACVVNRDVDQLRCIANRDSCIYKGCIYVCMYVCK